MFFFKEMRFYNFNEAIHYTTDWVNHFQNEIVIKVISK